MELKILKTKNTEDKTTWEKLWQQLPEERRDVYFLPGYIGAYEENESKEGLCMAFVKEDAVLLYPFLKCKIENTSFSEENHYDILSAYGYGGPVVNQAGENKEFLSECWLIFSNWCKKEKIVGEFCRMHPLLDNKRWAPSEMNVVNNRKTVVLDLNTYPESVWKESYFRIHRNMIRRAKRENFEYHRTKAVGQMGWFAASYDATQNILGASDETRFKKNYFDSLASGLGEKVWLAVVEKNNERVASVLVLEGEQFVHSHLMSYENDRSSKGATNYIYHHIALDAAERGKRYLHMGGGNSGNEDDALYKFKCSLSPDRREFYIGTRCHDSEIYNKLADSWEKLNGSLPKGYFLFYRKKNDKKEVNT